MSCYLTRSSLALVLCSGSVFGGDLGKYQVIGTCESDNLGKLEIAQLNMSEALAKSRYGAFVMTLKWSEGRDSVKVSPKNSGIPILTFTLTIGEGVETAYGSDGQTMLCTASW